MSVEEESKVDIVIPHVESAGEAKILDTFNLPHNYINNTTNAEPAREMIIDVKETEPGSGIYK